MTDLEKLTLLMSEDDTRTVRLGYALGYLHGQDRLVPDLPFSAPAFRALHDLGFPSR